MKLRARKYSSLNRSVARASTSYTNSVYRNNNVNTKQKQQKQESTESTESTEFADFITCGIIFFFILLLFCH
jgi:hypothetical protein